MASIKDIKAICPPPTDVYTKNPRCQESEG